MSEIGQIDIGRKVAALTTSPALVGYTGVEVVVSEEKSYFAGTRTGSVLTVSNPWGTQAIANYILSVISGFEYQPYEARDGIIPAEAELGDGLAVDDTYGGIYAQNLVFNPLLTSDASAPYQEEIDHEYPYIEKSQRQIERAVADVKATLTVDIDRIDARVESLSGDVAEIEATVTDQGSQISLVADSNGIKASAIVTAINGTSGIALDADHITLNGDTTINAINGATGTVKINANRVNMTGVLTWNNISGKPDVLIEDDEDTESYITTITENTVTAEYINAFELQATNLYGTDIYLQRTQNQLWANGHIYITGSSSSLSAIELNSAGALRLVAEDGAIYLDAFSYCGTSCELSIGGDCYPSSNGSYDLGTSSFRWADAWCTTGAWNGSDRRIKNSISSDLTQYEVMFNELKPVKYKLNDGTSGRFHIGFVAQDVEGALAAAKLDSADFGGFGRDKDADGNEILSLRYSEFIALNTLMIQKLQERVTELEQRLAEAS